MTPVAAVDERPASEPMAEQLVEPSDTTEDKTSKLPFTQREEIFQPPRADQVAKAAAREEGARVELRGFVNVDGIRALLAVNGQIKSVKVGQRYANIDVVAISPPQVTLQRGRVRWTERLYQEH